ncbi:helix-hairpin-helix domain-containing protein [Flavobacterium sp. CLA17]|uniref:ComEA family DNA-binding protein n=1 Tax=Flavobacterium sp. CLA17 TaxID=2724135 RepID=UPI001492FE8F|nr:helix-hairpin-helix domain-containing protein [Flavobacterium sp. CLA17]QSB26416.1 helix-hairpin-helix domain-containing protein [Flavobacterium sp. CLA17]
MSFKSLGIYFKFTKQQRIGIFTLFIIIIGLQAIYFCVNFTSAEKYFPEKEKWLAVQSEIDALKKEKYKNKPQVYLFNPNFISDYKGYKLGMSVDEIDRLMAFRKENKYVNSAEEFQQVTKISDSLLNVISPLFKFPEWVTNKKTLVSNKKEYTGYEKHKSQTFVKKEKKALQDINQATQEDLVKIFGVGEALSLRILKQKEILGGFVSMEQLSEVWGLSPEVLYELNTNFRIYSLPNFKKIPINDASLKELSQFHYFKYGLAKQIITYRSMNGDFKNIEDLAKIKGFPVDKAKIISLYLEF